MLDTTASIVTTAGNISITGTGSSASTGTAIRCADQHHQRRQFHQRQHTNHRHQRRRNRQRRRRAHHRRGAGRNRRDTVVITGKSVSTGATNGNFGVEISGAAIVTNSKATGLIDINGTGGGGAGTNRFGVTVAGSTVQATAGGSINVTGVGGGKFAGINIAATNPVIGNAATKNITLTASNAGGGDALALAAARSCKGRERSRCEGHAATTMGIGGAASATFDVQMNTTELGFIQPGFTDIVFGRSDGTGAITVGAGSTNANTTIQGSTSNIAINGAFATTGSKLTLSTGGTVTESGTGALTVNAGAGTLQLQGGGSFNLSNNNNTGTLNATGAALNFRDDTGFVGKRHRHNRQRYFVDYRQRHPDRHYSRRPRHGRHAQSQRRRAASTISAPRTTTSTP